jgi:hypothetical protein
MGSKVVGRRVLDQTRDTTHSYNVVVGGEVVIVAGSVVEYVIEVEVEVAREWDKVTATSTYGDVGAGRSMAASVERTPVGGEGSVLMNLKVLAQVWRWDRNMWWQMLAFLVVRREYLLA